jgi:hypothetical protein
MGATALNDDAEYDGTEHSSGNTNDGHGIHGVPSFPLVYFPMPRELMI